MSRVEAGGQSRPAVIVDLDGVVYRGREPIPGASEALRRLGASGHRIVFVTNNSTRTDAQVVAKLSSVAEYDADPTQIVTSARAALTLIPKTASTCMVVGGDGIREVVAEAGLNATDDPDEVDCVLVGLDPGFDYARLDAAATAIRAGALFIATNRDPTFPSASGLRPGAGAIVAAIETASGAAPVSAGKPEKPIRDLIRSRGVTRSWVIGDRLDTDVALAEAESDWTSILVLTGVTPPGSDTTPADHVVPDIAAAVDLVLSAGDAQ